MRLKPGRAGRRALVVGLVLAGFTLVLAVAPAFHHDFECHLKSPAHCPACLASPPALGNEAVDSLDAAVVPAAESVPGSDTRVPVPPTVASLKDRSPPF